MSDAKQITRRTFVAAAGAAAAARLVRSHAAPGDAASRPNILWITCEDISPSLGCYGDAYAITPNLDRLATQGTRYDNAFSVAGVCAPSRSCLITGLYPTSLGSQHMRSSVKLPPYVKCFTEYLRGAGYYCSNNVKTDYNFRHPKSAWDECSRKAHWRKREPGQPFFSVFNFTCTHESRMWASDKAFANLTRRLTQDERHDPAKAPLPPYHPDTPEVRRDWARYYDLITAMDKQAGDLLKQLDDDGLAEETIVFFYSDHGVGLSRGKFWLYDSGIHVPLIVRFPNKLRRLAPGEPGGATDRLVSFVDFGPTVLSLAGVRVPEHVQGRPFLGGQAAAPRDYVFACRDRMGGTLDLVRAVRDKRHKYIRNFITCGPYMRRGWWADKQHTGQELRRVATEGKLPKAAALFMSPTRPPEELYDVEADPHETHNLADSPEHRPILERFRNAQRHWSERTLDLGFMPEYEMHVRVPGAAPHEMARRGGQVFPYKRIRETIELSRLGPKALPTLRERLADADCAIRYWAIVGLIHLGDAARPAADAVAKAMADPSADVRLAAAEALCRLGRHDDALPVLIELLRHKDGWVRTRTAGLLCSLGDKARPAADDMRAALKDTNRYVPGILGYALKQMEPKP